MFKDAKLAMSTLWIVIMFNMIFADVLTLFIQDNLLEIIDGTTPVEITPMLMFYMALIIEIPIIMIFLSRFLKYRLNRILNIIAATITILFVIGGWSMDPHYLAFAVVEVLAALVIIKTAWQWSEKEAK